MSDKPDTKFDVGGVWDESEWRIVYDYEKTSVSPTYDPKPCPHASDIHGDLELGVKPEYNYPGTRWTVPRVVVAMNEGGYNSTGVCLDCILAAAATLDGKEVA